MSVDAYEYEDIQGAKVRIEDNPADAFIKIRADEFATWVVLPQRQRPAAAQALAGDEFVLVTKAAYDLARVGDFGPVKDTSIDPTDVRGLDVVEVEADDRSWLIRGTVTDIDPDHDPVRPFGITLHFHQGVIWPELFAATVRLVRRAEPEPDPEQVEALWNLGHELGQTRGEPLLDHEECRQLVRRGVTVRKET